MGVIGDRRDIVNRSIESQTERVLGSEGVQTTETVSASPTPPPVNLPSPLLPSVVVTLPTPNTERELSFGNIPLTEIIRYYYNMIKTYFINMFFHKNFTYKSQITHLALVDILTGKDIYIYATALI